MELLSQDIIYNFEMKDIENNVDRFSMPEYVDEVYEKIRISLGINEEGYNVYLIDDFSKFKLENILDYVKEILMKQSKPKDICYLIKEDENKPFPICLSGGKGTKLKEAMDHLQDKYFRVAYDFYNGDINKEKEEIIDKIQKKRTDLVNELMSSANELGFEIKSSNKGFTFIPLKSGEIMTEKEYDSLETEKKQKILSKVSELKNKSIKILESLKEIELVEVNKLKEIMLEYLKKETKEIKGKFAGEFLEDDEAIKFIYEMCEEIEEDISANYSMNYEEDEEKINEIINRYDINVLVDNSENSFPQVFFEEDPNVINLMGSIDYKSQSGTYVTDLSLIKAGSILRANEGCLIIRVNNLLANPTAYHNLKKVLLNRKVDLNYNKGYIDLLSISGIDPEPIKVEEKIILIGDYETYDILYNYDEDFKKIFKIKAQYNPVVDIDDNSKKSLITNIKDICAKYNVKILEDSAIKEIAKYLSRKAENRKKFFMDNEEITKLIAFSKNKVENEQGQSITDKDIIEVAYREDLVEREIREYYAENKILIDVNDNKVGQVNGLSVIDAGHFSLGKPIRITCSCCKGEGEILDVQKLSNLSGNIHSKAVNILNGLIGELFGKYNKMPVNFHLSFEQTYGKIEGDSASVAEFIAIVSSLSNLPVKQNIAVTGSLNQFGEVQAIGGVNEKIEGFFKVCRCLGSTKDKGVLIPVSNKNNLVLSREVEEAIVNGEFHIYTMKNSKEAIEILMGNYEEVIDASKREIKKYGKKNL